MRDDPNIHFWEGTTHRLWDGMSLVNCGGHFDGGTVLHWPGGADGRGALLTGDIIQVVMDPNLIPLSAAGISQILERIEPLAFEQIYGGWWERNIWSDGKGAINRSAERYLHAIGALPLS